MSREKQMKGQFTGRHMLATLVVGFGIVVAVNFTMASYAVEGFNGVVVENSYVASQNFNGWLEEARQQEALGWTATVGKGEDGRLTVDTTGVPVGAEVTAMLRRPMGDKTMTELSLIGTDADRYASASALPDGRWIVRLTVAANGHEWKSEGEVD